VFNERLEYVSPSGSKRLRTITLRSVCVKCARSIAAIADAGGDNTTIAALEVVAKVKDYLHESTDAKWQVVVRAMLRYNRGVQEGLGI
jgi:hypothetical protein